MPVNKVHPLPDLMKAVGEYIKKTKRKVMFEYLLIEGFNDGVEDADNLSRLMKSGLYHINLIKYHNTGSEFKPSSSKKRKEFFDLLKKRGVSATSRVSFGEDILAACGQLAGKNN
jgi:23S rRNA (adenine2503-C2)-methyltransferase